ncbi:MAG: sugar ABC transporter ATP-binding protein [Puia sp.]
MLRLENISKYFPGVRALQEVSLEIKAGEVHALCGENGAGKSTLMNIIGGNLSPDHGNIYWKGNPVQIKTVGTAQELGISIVYQEKSLVDSLSVAENIFPVNQPRNSFGLIDSRALFSRTKQLMDQLMLDNLAPQTVVGNLPGAQKGMVEIAKALAKNPSLLILDEPTASLTHRETEVLFRIIRQLKAAGVAVIYISHRMAEIKQIADVISVLKDGKYQGTVSVHAPAEQIVRMMVGRDLELAQYRSHAEQRTKLEVKNLNGKGFRHISFKLNRGEILGFAGLSASGRSAMARALFGDAEITGGELFVDEKQIYLRNPVDSMRAGIAYIPEDRKTEGLFMDRSVADNIGSASMQHGLYRKKAALTEAEELIRKFSIRTPEAKNVVSKLSGGNQQKVVIAKWLSLDPDILIVNEPTNGVDVGAKAEIYEILRAMTARGKSILMISSELPELLLLADRIAVMYNGSIIKILHHEEATEDKIASLASGMEEVQN